MSERNPQLAQAEINTTASAMPLARAHKVEPPDRADDTSLDNKKPSNLLGFFMVITLLHF